MNHTPTAIHRNSTKAFGCLFPLRTICSTSLLRLLHTVFELFFYSFVLFQSLCLQQHFLATLFCLFFLHWVLGKMGKARTRLRMNFDFRSNLNFYLTFLFICFMDESVLAQDCSLYFLFVF